MRSPLTESWNTPSRNRRNTPGCRMSPSAGRKPRRRPRTSARTYRGFGRHNPLGHPQGRVVDGQLRELAGSTPTVRCWPAPILNLFSKVMSPGRMTPLTTPVFSCCEWFFSSVVSEMTPCSREGSWYDHTGRRRATRRRRGEIHVVGDAPAARGSRASVHSPTGNNRSGGMVLMGSSARRTSTASCWALGILPQQRCCDLEHAATLTNPRADPSRAPLK